MFTSGILLALGLLGIGTSLFGTLKSAQSVAETNERNAEAVRETNSTNVRLNRDNNQLQRELADLAYERTLPVTQMQNLEDMGLTEQAARMLVASNGQAAQYPMPTTTAAHVDAPQYAAPSYDLSGVGSSLLSMATGIANLTESAYKSPDGGSLGISIAEGASNFLATHINDVPFSALTSWNTFSSWLDSIPDDSSQFADWIKFRSSAEYSAVKNNVLGRRAFVYNMHNSFDFAGDAYRLESMRIENKIKQNDLIISSIDSQVKQSDALVTITGNYYDLKNLPVLRLSDYLRASNDVQQLMIKHKYQSTDDFKSDFFKWLSADTKNQVLTAEASSKAKELQVKGFDQLSESEKVMLSYFSILSNASAGASYDWIDEFLVASKLIEVSPTLVSDTIDKVKPVAKQVAGIGFDLGKSALDLGKKSLDLHVDSLWQSFKSKYMSW